MGVLIIDEVTKSQVKRVLDYAHDPKRYFRPGKGSRVPGDDPHYVAQLSAYRCVFTISETPEGLYRHLSISIRSRGYANPIMAFTIAELFGFTGWDGKTADLSKNWVCHLSTKEHCIVLAQAIAEGEAVA